MRTLYTLLLAIGLAGCATKPAPAVYGNFIQGAASANDKRMANDVATKLTALYPPARTRFKLQQATPDVFGTTLVNALRNRGYALTEFTPATATEIAKQPPSPLGDLGLSYVVDQPMDMDQYRVTVLINNQSLSRIYQAKDGAIAPAGYWVRKE